MNTEKDQWVFITPIEGLVLSTEIKEELKIGNVIFVTNKKLPRIRNRLGLSVALKDFNKIIKENSSFQKFFSYSYTYAICHFTGSPEENKENNIRIIEDAINLLSFSKLGFSTRNFNNKIEIKPSDKRLSNNFLSIVKESRRFSLAFNALHPVPLLIDKKWKKFQNHFHYSNLMKSLNGNFIISSKWKNNLIEAAKLVGQSLNTHNTPDSFLKNVIAIEMLLTLQGDKILKKILERSEYLLGWSEHWINDDIENRIKKMYQKRCDYVHDGKTNHIVAEDLIFSDDLILNLFNNLIRNIKEIPNKEHLIKYSDLYQCKKQLNIKSKYRNPKFQYIRNNYESHHIKLL